MFQMNNFLEIESKIKKYIEEELSQINFTERPRDPLGFSIYLFFLLKNKVSSPATDNIIDWMNSWIDLIINQEKFSRFVDREITSALFGYYTLKINKTLKVSIDESKLVKFLSLNTNNNLYFDNLTYTILILLSLTDKRSDIPSFNRILQRIKDAIKEGTIINDAKNLVFSSILLEKLKDKDSLHELVNICYKKISEKDIRFDDRIYYSWVIWNYRKLMDEHFPSIRDFVEAALTNALTLLEEDEVDESIKEMYGSEVRFGVSRILLAILFDLIVEFNKLQIELSPFSYKYIKQRLLDLGWIDAWKEFEYSLDAFKEERLYDCCYNLRQGLLKVWIKIYEKLEKRPMLISPGKSVDISPLKEFLKARNVPDETVNLIGRIYSYVAERSHSEKKKIHSIDEVSFGIQLTFSAVEYLLRFYDQETKIG